MIRDVVEDIDNRNPTKSKNESLKDLNIVTLDDINDDIKQTKNDLKTQIDGK